MKKFPQNENEKTLFFSFFFSWWGQKTQFSEKKIHHHERKFRVEAHRLWHHIILSWRTIPVGSIVKIDARPTEKENACRWRKYCQAKVSKVSIEQPFQSDILKVTIFIGSQLILFWLKNGLTFDALGNMLEMFRALTSWLWELHVSSHTFVHRQLFSTNEITFPLLRWHLIFLRCWWSGCGAR